MSEKGKKRNVVSKMIKIDGEMLRRAIYDRNLVPMKMSQEMGMNSCYISHCMGDGSISPGPARMLEVMFGIKPEEYFYKEPEPEPEPVVEEPAAEEPEVVIPKVDEEFWERLNQTIYRAVYGALKRVYNEPYKPGSEAQNAGN